MAIDLREYSGYLQILHTDQMDITSKVTAEDEDGAEYSFYPESPQQVDVPCRISLTAKDTPATSQPFEKVELRPIVFCALDVQVRAGDRITVRRIHADGSVYETYKGLASTAGNPNKWSTHQEFELAMEGDA